MTEVARPATWWVPGRRTRKHGTYQVGEDGGVTITMHGDLIDGADIGVPVLWGEVGGRPVTCEGVWRSVTRGRGSSRMTTSWVSRSYEGAHIRNPAEHLFESVTFEATNLELFRCLRVLDGKLDSLGVHADMSEHAATMEVGGGQVRFYPYATTRIGGYPESVSVEARHAIHATPASPSTRASLWTEFIMPVAGLLTIAGQGGGRLTSLKLYRSGRAHRFQREVTVRATRWKGKHEPSNLGEMMIHAKNWDFETHLVDWFGLWRSCPVAFTSYTESLASMGSAPALLNAVGACEALHSTLYPRSNEPTARQSARLGRILDGLSSSDRSWAYGLLKAGHGLSLEGRLKALARGLDPTFTNAMLREIPAWSHHAADARNAIAHSDPRAVDYLTNPRLLHVLTATLQYVFALTVMQRIGFNAVDAADAYRQHVYLGQGVGDYPNVMYGLDALRP